MPITPLHFAPSALVSLPLGRYIDVPAFLLANVIIDFEPSLVMTMNLSYPLHGYAHTYLGSILHATILGLLLYRYRNRMQIFTAGWRLPSCSQTRARLIVSSILGGWLHVAVDSVIYHDMFPFYPFGGNPLRGLTDQDSLYIICTVLFIPVFMLWGWMYYVKREKE